MSDVKDELRVYGRFLDGLIRDPGSEEVAVFTPAEQKRQPLQVSRARTAALALAVPVVSTLVVVGVVWLMGYGSPGQAPVGQVPATEPADQPPMTTVAPTPTIDDITWLPPLTSGSGYVAMVDGFPTLGIAGDLYVAFGLGSGQDRYSVDGVDWSTPAPQGLGAYDIHRIDGRFALGGRDGDVVLLHDDGSRWVPVGVVAQDDWGFERNLRVVGDTAYVYNYGDGVWVSNGLSLDLRDDVIWAGASDRASPPELPPTDGEHLVTYAFDLGYVAFALDREKVQAADLDGDAFEMRCPDCVEAWISADGVEWVESTPVPDPGFRADESKGAVGELVFHGFMGKDPTEVDWRGVLYIGRLGP